MSRLVDPIHFFNARGKSVLTQEGLEERVEELTMENQRLKRMLKLAAQRLRQAGQVKEAAKRH